MKTLTKYDILVVVLNKLYLVLVIGLYTRYGVQLLSTSRGDGNKNKSESFQGLTDSIDTYLPREGTETISQNNISCCFAKLYISLSTSRGAGNFSFRKRTSVSYGYSIDTYLPREGSETPCNHLRRTSTAYVQLPIYLARGRKLVICEVYVKFKFTKVQLPIYLERGRKLYQISAKLWKLLSSIDTYLPREGTEIFGIRFLLHQRKDCIATYLPREGPETLLSILYCV